MMYSAIYKISRIFKEKIIFNLIKFFVKHELINLLCILILLNLKKIKEIEPKEKIKNRILVLSKSAGLDDLINSQRRYNKNILYLNFDRSFIKRIFETIYEINERKNLKKVLKKNDKKLDEKYFNFLTKFLIKFNKIYKFDAFIGFNFNYFAETSLHKACKNLDIPFLLLYKEGICTPLEKKYLIHSLKYSKEKFHGKKIAVYSDDIKQALIKSGFVNKKNVEVIGCSRLSESYALKKIAPKNQILYYAIQKDRGLPHRFLRKYGNKFFKNLLCHEKFDPKYNWNNLHLKTLKLLKKFALKNPQVPIIIKVKIGSLNNKKQYRNLPSNIKMQFFGTGHKFIRESKIIIAWNTTALLEGIASNRFILVPYFYSRNYFKKQIELNLKLKNKNYGYTENDFYNKLTYFNSIKFDKNKNNNNLFSLKYYLGNSDDNAGKRLNIFLKKSLN